jgi:hypothetical protein
MFLKFFTILILLGSIAQAEKGCRENGIVSILKTYIQTTKDFVCEPEIGKPIDVSDWINEPTRKFRITKLDEKNYLAEINLKLHDSAKNSNPDAEQKLNKEKIQEYQKCFDNLEPYLKGPNGESLRIKISNQAPRQDVLVTHNTIQSYTSEYSDQLTCAGLLHETFHAFGMSDEYEETSSGYNLDKITGKKIFVETGAKVLNYDCRVVPGVVSIMNNHHEAVIEAENPYFYKLCKCDQKAPRKTVVKCNKDFELQFGKVSNLKSCPKGSRFISFYGQENLLEKDVLLMAPRIKDPSRSLLKPAYFRMITHPNRLCGANKKYLECAKSAYESSWENQDKKCHEKPKECKLGEWLN